MLTLNDFLLARFAEEEEAARSCAATYPPPWEVLDRGHTAKVSCDLPHFLAVTELAQEQAGDAGWLGDRLEHIARHAPDRVLLDCEAKRRILALDEQEWISGGLEVRDDEARAAALVLDSVARLLALRYVDHPDYREEWRP